MTPSRPITYIKRDTPACAEIPEASTAMTAKYNTNFLNAMPVIAVRMVALPSASSITG